MKNLSYFLLSSTLQQHAHAQKYTKYNDLQSILISLDPLKINAHKTGERIFTVL